jgi:predicted helicase
LPLSVSKDENVFDIQQGVAIGLFVREAGHQGQAQVFYQELWGKQQEKYHYLVDHDITTTQWTLLQPNAPFYFFIERNLPDLADEYRAWPSVTQIFVSYSLGIISARDRFAYASTRAKLEARLNTFADIHRYSDESFVEQYALKNTSSWTLADARTKLNRDGVDAAKVVQCQYRPFDRQWTYYSKNVLERPLADVLSHLLQPNLALITFRHTRRLTPMRTFAARHVVDARLLSSESNCYAFPLYRYTNQPAAGGQIALDLSRGTGREPNLDAHLLPTLASQYGAAVTQEDLFYYLYGVLNAPGYQQEFEALLQVDFPRIPFTTDYDIFGQMVERGQRVVALHLLEAPDLQGMANLTVGFPVVGNDQVERGYPQRNPTEERVYINPTQYFEGITQAMWDYKVGSYNPLEKWLKDRRGRTLSAADRRHYETFATAIKKLLDELPQLETAWQAILGGGWFNPLA